MKKLLIISLTILSIFFTNAEAQWVQTNGPYGGEVTKIVHTDSFIILGTNNGIAISQDGMNWSYFNNGLASPTISDIEVVGNDVFIIAGTNLYCSSNWGVTKGNAWKNIKELYDIEYSNDYLTSNGTNLYLGTSNSLFISKDKGLTFSIIQGNLPVGRKSALAAKDNSIFVSIKGSGLFRSVDNGLNWTNLYSKLTSYDIYNLDFLESDLYAASQGGKVFKSSDNGNNWENVKGLENIYVNCMTFYRDSLFVGSLGMLRSTDNGITWPPINNGIPNTNFVLSTNFLGNNLFAGTFRGLYLSRDFGLNWTKVDFNASANIPLEVFSIATDNGILYAAAKGGVYSSTDKGSTWYECNNDLPYDDYSTITTKNNYLFVGSKANGIFVSTDKGKTWTVINKGVNKYYLGYLPIKCLIICDNTVYATFDSFINDTYYGSECAFYSILDYYSWSEEYELGNVYPEYMATYNNYIVTSNISTVSISKDAGYSWQTKEVDPSNLENTAIAINEKVLIVGGSYRICKSTDLGNTWTQIRNSNNINFGYVKAILLIENSVFLTAGSSILYSSDAGDNWKYLSIPASMKELTYFSNDAENVYVATKNGIWERQLSYFGITNSEAIKQTHPFNFQLYQNYPNPFNPTTTISYSIPVVETAHAPSLRVLLKVYDVLGREVATLVDEEKPAGNYQVKFDAGNMTSGIYFYTVKAGEFSQTKKLILMK